MSDLPVMAGWVDDVWAALRALRASRWTTLTAVVTLALGTGANLAVFAVTYGVLLRPLPFADSERLVRITTERPVDGSDLGLSLTEFDEWQRQLTTVSSVAAYARAEFTVRGAGDPEVLETTAVTGDFFRTLGVPPAGGQAFEDDRASNVVVAGDRYARRLSGSGSVLGRQLSIGALGMDVAGVMPAAFAFPDDQSDLWVPARSVPTVSVFDVLRDFRRFRLVARLRPGVALEDARRDAERALHVIAPGVTGRHAVVRRLDDEMVAAARPVLVAFTAAGVLVLLVACANVATLLAGRAVSRTRELALRLAIGAERGRLVRVALIESAVVAVVASLAGLWVAHMTLAILVPLAGESLPRANAIRLDLPVLAAGMVIALMVALACGVAPALAAVRSDIATVLRREASSTTGGAHRMRGPLVVAQIALAVLLLTGAGLFARTVWVLWTTDIGASRDRVLTARLALTETTRFDASSRNRFVHDLLDRIRALPGVEAAGLGSNLPPRVNQLEMTVRFLDEATGRDDTHGMNFVAVTPGYFRALGVPIKRGREFEDADAIGAPVAVVSEMLEHQIASKRDILNTQLVLSVPSAGGKRVQPIVVGIASDVKYVGLEHPTEGNIYVPWTQLPTGVSYLVIRSVAEPTALAPIVVREIHDLDPSLPLPAIRPLADEMALAMATRTLRLKLVAAFGTLALLVSVVGLTSALARSVIERQRELAIRLAIGATPSRAVRLIVGHGTRLIVVGLVAGAGAALAVGRLMATLLFGVSAYDPIAYGAVVALVLLVGLAACYLPARRAAAIDPISLLKAN